MSSKTSLEKQVLTALALACALSGCATRSPRADSRDEIRRDENSPSALRRPLSSGRDIASEPESFIGELSEESLHKYFDVLWGSIDPSREVERNLEQLVRMYYRAERQLRAFDAELDQELAANRKHKHLLAEMNSYSEMLAHWELSHRALQKISFVYDQLLEIRAENEKDSDDYKRAERALQSIHQFFQHAKGSDRLALHSVSLELKNVFDQYAAEGNAPKIRNAPYPFANTLFEGREKVGEFSRKSEVQNELIQKSVNTEALEEDEFDVELNKSLGDLHAGFRQSLMPLTENEPGREPQAENLRFYPSSGSHGSISGVEYPKGTWSLTFDDGPSTKYTPMVLKNLKDHGLHSTFFELATNVDSDKKTSLAVLNAGMEMANHSYTHPQLPKLDDAHLRHQIVDSTYVEVKVWGEDHRPKLFRCPYGAGLTVKRVRDAIAQQGFIHVFWNVDTLDWQDKNPESILTRAKKEMAVEGGGIILFHDIHPQSVEASRMTMDWIKQKGYRHMLVGDVIKELNEKAKK
jgi:peptidoglycan/xylan/chitin deacetylase (PgdA/CDA1 family)